MTKEEARTKSTIITTVYCGSALLALLSAFPNSIFNGFWVYIVMLLTIPVSFIGFGIIYSMKQSLLPLLIAHTIVSFIFWLLVYNYLRNKNSHS
jgi:hypothetical protein